MIEKELANITKKQITYKFYLDSYEIEEKNSFNYLMTLIILIFFKLLEDEL